MTSIFSDYQQRLKALLLFFDRFCRKNQITYSVCCGTLLGLIRHADIIPWDGDIDVVMTRKEYERFKKAFANYSGRFYLEDIYSKPFKSDKRRDFLSITAKLVDKKSNSPLFCIDIYTLDFLGNDFKKASVAVSKYKKYYHLAKFFLSFHLPPLRRTNSIFKNFIILMIHFFHPVLFLVFWIAKPLFIKSYSKFEKHYLSYDEKSKYCTLIPYYLKKIVVEENFINGFIDLTFGNITVMAFRNYDLVLKKSYGEYMVLPPVEKRKPYPSETELLKVSIESDEELNELLDSINN